MKKNLFVLITALSILFIAGCSNKKSISEDSFSIIEIGMSKKDVEKTLGKPSDVNEGLDNQRVLKQLVPFQDLILSSKDTFPVSDTLKSQLSTTIEKIKDGASVTYYIYDYESKKSDEETSTQVVFCDNKVSLILIDEQMDNLYDSETN